MFSLCLMVRFEMAAMKKLSYTVQTGAKGGSCSAV